MKYLLIVFSFLVFISCSKKNMVVLFDTKTSHLYEEVSIKELKKNYNEYNGKWLIVTDGFINMDYEYSVLQPQIRMNINDVSDIWVWYPDRGFNDIFKRINKKKVIIKGFFTTSSRGHLGLYPGAIKDVTYIAVYE
ncbi:hypothetical protein [Apibacter sp. HY039]|uniref:hypothetical protein n=1 Tax=Apibacter sp. HY039 TaxID=2501476 RepID=UPI000FEBA702|nr:hypothetical protein [Apibacter sp. HY039]